MVLNLEKMNNKTKKQYISIGLALFIIILIFSFFYREKELPLIVPYEQNYTEVKAVLETKTETYNNEKVSQIGPKALSVETIKVSLTVSGHKYNTEIKEGSSVIEAMKQIERESSDENKFSFKYTDNASLGSFITEINGAKGTPGKYWIYYINRKLGSIGVSNYILKEGDIINWNQEGI